MYKLTMGFLTKPRHFAQSSLQLLVGEVYLSPKKVNRKSTMVTKNPGTMDLPDFFWWKQQHGFSEIQVFQKPSLRTYWIPYLFKGYTSWDAMTFNPQDAIFQSGGPPCIVRKTRIQPTRNFQPTRFGKKPPKPLRAATDGILWSGTFHIPHGNTLGRIKAGEDGLEPEPTNLFPAPIHGVYMVYLPNMNDWFLWKMHV